MCDVLERWRYRKWHLIDVMDEELSPLLAATCGRFGDAWGDHSCGNTRNYLRALYAQRAAANMVEAFERRQKPWTNPKNHRDRRPFR